VLDSVASHAHRWLITERNRSIKKYRETRIKLRFFRLYFDNFLSSINIFDLQKSCQLFFSEKKENQIA